MKLDPKIEEKIKSEALKLMKAGRTNWDVRHTLNSVKWMKKLIQGENGNERILLPAIYFHDTGYDKLPLGYGHKLCLASKKGHPENGADNAKEFLPQFNYFTNSEINRIAYLVLRHSQHDNIKEKDRQLVFEADTLGQLDWHNCKPSYNKENTILFFTTTYKERLEFVKTKTAKNIIKKLLPQAEDYLAHWSQYYYHR